MSKLQRSPAEAWEHLRGLFSRDEVGFYYAATRDELSQLQASRKLAQEVLAGGKITDILFLGIGGSALGPICLLSALEHRRKTTVKFHFAENPDPIDWSLTLRTLRPESTLVCAVTKSGGTFETISQLLIALEWMGRERWSSNLIAITDPQKGDLRQFATDHALRTLEIAPSIGGRFSIFSPVGLFASELAGLDTEAFLKGASQVFDYCEKQPLEKNALVTFAQELIRHAHSHPVHVCMPYSTRLRLIGDWFVQLWGESLGKDGKGFTPIGAVGATDQHSILQLLRDGPDDKITWFVTVGEIEDVKIPKAPLSPTRGSYASFALLEGHSLQDLLMTEYRATSLVLMKQRRPQATFQIDQLDERSLGALLYAWSLLTAVTGALWGVNPFDQPGVEEGKIYTKEALAQIRSDALDARNAAEDDGNSAVNRLRRNHQD
jgi:glucose-6-phosphate isomerase